MAVLKEINLTGFGKRYQGKVRDFYVVGNKRILITTDRISAFDRVLGLIEDKGQVLNQLAAFWFDKTKDIIPNHLLAVPDPNVLVAKNCQAYPVEMVVRGYISGVTHTSLWYNYFQGKRLLYGMKFPDGLKKNQKLAKPVITPTTRGTGVGGHDEQISKAEIIKRKIISRKVYEEMEKAALALFKRGSEICDKAGLILVDTKYEFGDDKGKLTLIDEIHTPDSSRFWIKKSYEKRMKKGLEPENFDKEFFRLWYNQRNYYGDGQPPKMPAAFKQKISQRYQQIYEKITGEKLVRAKGDISMRIKNNLAILTDQVVIISGSVKDKEFVTKIETELKNLKLRFRTYYASAHKQPLAVLQLIKQYSLFGNKVVMITVAGRSNALSGFVAANCQLPVIACPPFKDRHDYLINIHSSLQMPSQVPVMTVIDPGNAALAAKRILSV
ncbi:MAG: phosphoribosylaminoimidazolesuccinocarboxamide synthase [Candidatus Beckwithbacteria bacterium]|nr:phosphoribosylaminoimidazolesuccinocarboxamide synthase [Candidatus Beckwithbacteria bacterium]